MKFVQMNRDDGDVEVKRRIHPSTQVQWYSTGLGGDFREGPILKEVSDADMKGLWGTKVSGLPVYFSVADKDAANATIRLWPVPHADGGLLLK